MKILQTALAAIGITMLTFTVNAKTMAELLKAGSAEEIGLAIATEADIRDFGFGNSEVNVTMELRNASGQSAKREMRNKTFEITDKDAGDKSMIIFDRPRDVKGTAFLTFSKILEADDQWLYLPKLGKVKRISSKNKSGPFMGSEFSYEDISSTEVGKYTYKYIGKDTCENGMACVVVERFPVYKHSGYTKQTVWYDETEFRIWQVNSYDRKKSHLKTMKVDKYAQYLNKYWRPNMFRMVNHQTGKETDLVWSNYQFKTGLKESDLTKADLKNAQ